MSTQMYSERERNDNSIFNPMEQFDLSQSNIGDNSINTSTISTVDKSFMKKINKFQRELNPNQKNFPETIYEEDWEER